MMEISIERILVRKENKIETEEESPIEASRKKPALRTADLQACG